MEELSSSDSSELQKLQIADQVTPTLSQNYYGIYFIYFFAKEQKTIKTTGQQDNRTTVSQHHIITSITSITAIAASHHRSIM